MWFQKKDKKQIVISQKIEQFLEMLYKAIAEGRCGFSNHVSRWGYPESFHGDLAMEGGAFGYWDLGSDYDSKSKTALQIEFRIYESRENTDKDERVSIEFCVKQSQSTLVEKIYELIKQKRNEKSLDLLLNSLKGIRDGDVDLKERQSAWAAARSLLITDEKQLEQLREVLVNTTELPIMIVMPGYNDNLNEGLIIVTEETQNEARTKIDALIIANKASHWLRYVYELFPFLKHTTENESK